MSKSDPLRHWPCLEDQCILTNRESFTFFELKGCEAPTLAFSLLEGLFCLADFSLRPKSWQYLLEFC